MSKKQFKRREFVQNTGTAAMAFTILPRHVLGGKGFVPPSDKINVANIGCGTQGIREMGAMLENEDVQVAALCDPNKYNTYYRDWSANGLVRGMQRVLDDKEWGKDIKGIAGGLEITQRYVNTYYQKKKGNSFQGVAVYEDFRELLAKESDIDAVKIMTPDHLHATVAIAAMKAGKHVFTHKPIANRLQEGKMTIEMARKTGVVTDLLAWSPIPEYGLIREWIEGGVIGKLQQIINWSYRPVWPQWVSIPEEKVPVPEGFNWELWLGPVPDRPYHPNYTHNFFRGWYDFGGGSMADMGHYSLFPLFQKMEIDKPPYLVKAYGTTNRTVEEGVCKGIKNDVAFPYSAVVQYKFPAQKFLPEFELIWMDGGMKPFLPDELLEDGKDMPNEGMLFIGDQGKILAGFEGEKPAIIPQKKMEAYSGTQSVPEAERVNRTFFWSDAIKKGEQAPGNFISAETVTETINLAAVALRAGGIIEYDAATSRITNDESANQYLTREYRPGWELNATS